MSELDSKSQSSTNGAGRDTLAGSVRQAPEPSDEDRPADEKLVPRPAPGLGPIGPAGDPSYMEGTLSGTGPRRGFVVIVALMAVLVILAIAFALGG
jgi:hypothetical protein